MKILNLILALLCTLSASAFDGNWRGRLDAGAVKLSIVFHIKTNPRSCTMDSPDQGVKGIPASITFCAKDTISLFVPTIGASFNGKLSDNQISGTFSQSGHSFPLTLEQDSPELNRRPQTPQPPYPYKEEEISFKSSDETLLSGTLFMPEKPIAAVVFVTGSGAQNRDEEIFEHKPFLVIADKLARAGIASLRYDDRGVDKSEGDFSSATIFTFCDDATAAVNYLKTTGITYPIGVIGHSEGGTIAFMLAAEGKVDFAVSLAGAAQSGLDVLVEQNRDALISMGVSDLELEHSTLLIRAYLQEIGNNKRPNVQLIAKENGLTNVNEAIMRQAIRDDGSNTNKWFKTFINLKPTDYIKDIKCPLLAVNGTLDTQVKSSLNLPIIRNLLPNAKIKEYEGLNHLFQHATTGSVAEYGEISETFAEEVIADIISFIITSK